MQHSPFDRFYGTLCGSFLGEALSSPSLSNNIPNWCEISNTLSHKVLQQGNLAELLQRDSLAFASLDFSGGSDRAALASLPLVLFFHDRLELLQQYLVAFSNLWQNSATIRDDLLLWGCVIALILREKFDYSDPFDRFARFPDLANNSLLALWQGFPNPLQGNARIGQTLRQLGKSITGDRLSLLSALAYFAAMPTNLRLCVELVRRLDCSNSTISLLGALSGAYNGYCGIPIAWRATLRDLPLSHSLEVNTGKLLAVWAGADPTKIVFSDNNLAVAAPLTVQPRSNIPSLSLSSVRYPLDIDT